MAFVTESIRENLPGPAAGPRLPDCCNLGVWLRVLLGVNAASLLSAFANSSAARWDDASEQILGRFVDAAALLEPATLASLIVLCALRRPLRRLGPRVGVALILAAVLAATSFFHALFSLALERPLWPSLVWAALAVASFVGYFDLRARAQSPAISEARLQALTARIRPHFLFNTLNAVLGVVRSDPQRAEHALEELADLFRALMRDNRDLVPLSEELGLARQYLELEKLRLGERLRVRWDVESCPPDALVPPLLLQPLAENAVYHGIEPAPDGGELAVRITADRNSLLIEMSNPLSPTPGSASAGNRMALANIRERLMLFYDIEGRLDTVEDAGRYTVRIELPVRR